MSADPLQSGSQTNEIVLNIRKRKGAWGRAAGAAREGRCGKGGQERRCPRPFHELHPSLNARLCAASLKPSLQVCAPTSRPSANTRVSERAGGGRVGCRSVEGTHPRASLESLSSCICILPLPDMQTSSKLSCHRRAMDVPWTWHECSGVAAHLAAACRARAERTPPCPPPVLGFGSV